MSNIEVELERAGAEIRDAGRALPDRRWVSRNPRPRRIARPALVAAAFAVTMLVLGGTALMITSTSSDQPVGSEPGTTANEQVPPAAEPVATPTTLTPPTTLFVASRELINLVDEITGVIASSEVPGFPASNLTDGSTATAWNDASLKGEGAVLTFEFARPVYLDSIVISNHGDGRTLLRNFRIKDFEIEYQTVDGPEFLMSTASGTAEPLTIDIETVHQGPLVIRVLSVWPAESDDGLPAFLELAVGEIEFYGIAFTNAETESALREAEALVADLDAEIANLREALATASKDAAEEMRDMLTVAEKARSDAVRRTTEMARMLKAISEGADG